MTRLKFRALFAVALVCGVLTAATSASSAHHTDPPPAVSVVFTDRDEPDTGQVRHRVYFTLDHPAIHIDDRGWASVRVRTQDGTATLADRDYRRVNRVVRWGPGVDSRFYDFTIVGDTDFEPDEYFNIVLSNPVDVSLPQEVWPFYIWNNDPDVETPPIVSIEDASIVERDGGVRTVRMRVTLDRRSPGGMTRRVRVTTADGTATVADGDYRARSQVVTFPRNRLSRIISIQVRGDRTVEPDEQFTVVLSDPIGLELGDSTGTVTIVNDD